MKTRVEWVTTATIEAAWLAVVEFVKSELKIKNKPQS